jgi:hypothetical protein
LISPQCGALNVPLPLRISWNSVGGAIFYRVQVSAVRDFKTVVNDTSGIVDTSVAVKGLANTTRYYWRVNATDEGHSISDWSAACSLMTFPVAPSIIKLLWPQDRQTFTNPSDSVRCRWTMGGAREITAYRLEMATDSAFVKIIVDSTVSDTVAWVRKLANKTTYWWRVQARNAAGVGPVSAVSCFSINFATTATLPREYGISFSGLHAQGGVIKYALPRKSSVSLRIVNPKGQSVFVHESSNQEPGRYSIPLNGRSLSPTCYIVIFKAGTFEMKKRLMVIE